MTSPIAPACVAEHLTVGYRDRRRLRPVLADLDLQLLPGSLTCLLGPNGSGKSTLLRTLAGLQPALDGRLRLLDRDVTTLDRRELARLVGVVLTERVTIGALSVREVVALGRYPHRSWNRSSSAADETAVDWAIEVTGTQPLAHRDIGELSDGERQRVMIARALAQEPAVLLLDEPTAFLDIVRRVDVLRLLRRLAAETSRAVLCTLHDLELALRAADVVWLVDGAEVLVGAPEDLVLDGSFSRCFASEGLEFDDVEGHFRVRGRTRGRARVSGEERYVRWTARALERIGFDLLDGSSGPVDVEVSIESLGCDVSWTVVAGQQQGSYSSVADLVSALDERASCQPHRSI